MELSIGCNWDPNLVETIAGFPQVREYMAALPMQAIGTDRPPKVLPTATREDVAKYVRLIHESGRTINFLLNAPSLGGREFSARRRSEVIGNLAWLDDIGVDAVTVCTPGLVELVRSHFPRLQVHVSQNAGIVLPDQVRGYEDLGVAAICVQRANNRNLPWLATLARSSSVPLQASCISVCVPGCPSQTVNYHLSITSTLCTQGAVTDKDTRHGHFRCISWCHRKRIGTPHVLLHGYYLRPEDVPIVEENTGIRWFKLDTRSLKTPAIVAAVRAYVSGRYDGDLKDLLSMYHFARFGKQEAAPGPLPPVESLTDEEIVDTVFNLSTRVRYPTLFKVDNRALDGYLNEIADVPCGPSCENCSRCSEYADRAFSWNEHDRSEALAVLERYGDWLLNR